MKVLVFFILFLHYCFARDDDSNSRNRFMPFAAAAYSNNPNQCLANIQKHWNPLDAWSDKIWVYRQYTYNCGTIDGGCAGYIAVEQTTMDGYGFIILTFRGTSDYDQQMFQQGWNYTEMVPFLAGGKVGTYFFDTFNNVWNKGGMKDDVYTLKNKYPTYRFHVVGHSLGGAVASIAAATIVSTGIASANRTHLYTFGEPRSGDKDYANAFISLQINSIRIVHNRDAVPHLPSLNDTVYYHHVREIWYPTDEMSDIEPYFECSSIDGEDPKCANSLNDTLNFDDHKKYFGRDFRYYGINGCNDL